MNDDLTELYRITEQQHDKYLEPPDDEEDDEEDDESRKVMEEN